MSTINELKWSSLTRAINEIKGPQTFIRNLLYSNVETKPTEDIEISSFTGGREIAPFVKKGSSAVMVGGFGETFATVAAPNIRIKRPMTPSELLFGRRPGTVIFPNPGQQRGAIRGHIARDLLRLETLIQNAEEYLCAQTLEGVVSYDATSGTDEESFTITFPRDAGNTVTLAGTDLWSDAAKTALHIWEDFHSAKEVVSEQTGLTVTHAIMGKSAAQEFRAKVGESNLLDSRRVVAGNLDLVNQFDGNGAIFLGNFAGVDCWEYGRQVTVNGTATDLVAAGKVFFVSATPAAENVLYYGAVPDEDVLEGRLFQGRRFVKSWTEKDPAVRQNLAHARPLPVPRRPNSIYELIV